MQKCGPIGALRGGQGWDTLWPMPIPRRVSDSPEVLALAERIYHDFGRFAFNSRGSVAKKLGIKRATIASVERRIAIKCARVLAIHST